MATHRQRTPWEIQRAVVFAMMMRELKTRFGGHWTGVVWLLGIPVVEMAVFMWMNTTLRGRGDIAGFTWPVFLVCGLLPYQVFRSLWNQLANAAGANRGLFGFRQVKPMDAFVARAALEVALEVVTFVILVLLMIRVGFGPLVPHDLLGFMAVWGLFSLIGFGMGISWAVIEDVLPRFGVVTHVIAMPLMLVSGVIFPLHKAPPEMIAWLLYNPLLHLVEEARYFYLPGYMPVPGVSLAYPAMFCLCIVTLGMVLYRWRRKQLIAS